MWLMLDEPRRPHFEMPGAAALSPRSRFRDDGAMRRFDEIGRRLLKHRANFVLIIATQPRNAFRGRCADRRGFEREPFLEIPPPRPSPTSGPT